MRILSDFTSGHTSAESFQTLLIRQYCEIDSGVNWLREWGDDVHRVLDDLWGACEVYYPAAPEESYVDEQSLMATARGALTALDATLQRRGSS